MDSLLGGLSSQLTKRAALVFVLPPLVVWLAGVAALMWHDDVVWWGWGLISFVPGHDAWLLETRKWLVGLSLGERLGLLAAVVGASALLAELFVLTALQYTEGYWPEWLKILLSKSIAEKAAWVEQARQRCDDLRARYATLAPEEVVELTILENRLTIRSSARRPMPTQLGDILAAAETRPADKYGLNVGLCFPRLWLVMPDSTRQELIATREALDIGARLWLWGVVLCVWGILLWWAFLVGFMVATLSYRAMLSAATSYADLLESAFDLHHTALFQALRWPLPANPVEERATGVEVTQYLWYADRQQTPTFTGSQSSLVTAQENEGQITRPDQTPPEGEL